MLTSTDPAILHALTNVRYQVVPWLRHQVIDSKDYNEVIRLLLSLCNANGLLIGRDDLIEPQSQIYFQKHGFFNLVFKTRLAPETIPTASDETLAKLDFIGVVDPSKVVDHSLFETKVKMASTLLLGADKDAPCFLKAMLIPFGSLPGEPRPYSVLCTAACLTNVADIWGITSFPIKI